MTVQIRPTHCAVIDPLRPCPAKCQFCYYRHQNETWVKPWPTVSMEIDAAKGRGNERIDVTGGEPMVYPQAVELVRHAQGHGMRIRIITSCLGNEKFLDELLQKDPPAWLISMHGVEADHDALVGVAGARKRQRVWIDRILASPRPELSINHVLVRDNVAHLAEFAKSIAPYRPQIVNFINFNPHHEWATNRASLDIVADLRIAQAQWEEVIGVLEEAGAGVNLRYYPMCLVPAQYRRCVCNDLHVLFDAWEWDYGVMPKTLETYYRCGMQICMANEEKGPPCSGCGLQWICGGANRHWHAAAKSLFGEILTPQPSNGANPRDFWYYRKENDRGCNR